MDKLGRPADKMRIKKVLEEFYRLVNISWVAGWLGLLKPRVAIHMYIPCVMSKLC